MAIFRETRIKDMRKNLSGSLMSALDRKLIAKGREVSWREMA